MTCRNTFESFWVTSISWQSIHEYFFHSAYFSFFKPNLFFLVLLYSCLSPLIASLHELPQEITFTNISKMKQLKSGWKLFQGGIRSSFLFKSVWWDWKIQSYRQHSDYVRCGMCHTSMYTESLGWQVPDMRLVGGLAAGESGVWGFYRGR